MKKLDMPLMLKLDPSTLAHLEIVELGSQKAFQKIIRPGRTGPLPPDDVAKNRNAESRYRRQRAKIIAKYGVFDEYLAPLKAEERQLAMKLATVRIEIATLKKLREKKSKAAP